MPNTDKIKAMIANATATYAVQSQDACCICYWVRGQTGCELRGSSEPNGLCGEFAQFDEVVDEDGEVKE